MYSYPATFLQGAAAATGVALINSIANIGGMIGPYLIGGRATLSALLF
jgi:ACS family tartrate transporter-like MFS transporter